MSKKDKENESATPSESTLSLEECKKELDYWKDQFLRAKADFENFKRRIEKEKEQWYQTAQAVLLLDLLPVIDNFDRALEEKQKEEYSPELKAWLEGFELIRKSLHKLLSKYDIKEIKIKAEFDPHLHEAVAQVISPEHKTGQIVEVIEKGYTLKDTVLRPAKVTIAR
jgi:molecular chaperone GrpE